LKLGRVDRFSLREAGSHRADAVWVSNADLLVGVAIAVDL
jgi:hypothetical protein